MGESHFRHVNVSPGSAPTFAVAVELAPRPAAPLPYEADGQSDLARKVSIVARGPGCGVTVQLPESDRYLTSKAGPHVRRGAAVGGRAAEEIISGDVSSKPLTGEIPCGRPCRHRVRATSRVGQL